MARKTKEETKKTILAILDAAEQVFVKNGVANTTMADIAKHAKVSRGAIYGHFKDKIEVCTAVCERAMQQAKQIRATKAGETVMDTLSRMALSYLRTVHFTPSVRHALEIIYIRCELSAEYAPIQRYRTHWDNQTYRTILTLVEKAIQTKELPSDLNLKLATAYLICVLEGISSMFWCRNYLNPDPWPKVEKLIGAGLDTLRLSPALRHSDDQ